MQEKRDEARIITCLYAWQVLVQLLIVLDELEVSRADEGPSFNIGLMGRISRQKISRGSQE